MPGPGRPGAGRPGAGGSLARGVPTKPGQKGGRQAEQTVEEASPELEQLFARVERDIHKLQLEFQRYFAGDVHVPPEATRREIDNELKRLRNMNMRRSVDRFRYSSLEAKFNSFNEMFNRRLRAIEEGKVPPPRARLKATAPAAAKEADGGVLLGARPDPTAVESLFKELLVRSPRGTSMDLDTFRGYLERQVASIREKTGCEAVQFRLVAEDGKVKLRAKPVGAAGGPANG